MKNTFLPLLAGFILSFLPLSLHAQSCNTQCAGTTFEPRSGITGICEIDDVRLFDSSSEGITVPATFQNGAVPDRGCYSVHDNTLSVGISEGNVGLVSYTLTDLITDAGRNQYVIVVEGNVTTRPGCTPTNNGHRTNLFLRHGNQNVAQFNKENPNTGSFSMEYSFTASSARTSFSLISDYSSDCNIVNITSITVTGCANQKISSENGNTVCFGEDNVLYAKGLSASTYTWEESTDNATWTVIPETGQSITVRPHQGTYYRVTGGGTTLEAIYIRPQVCCSVAGDRSYDFENWAETFDFDGDRTSLTINEIGYRYAGSDNVTEGTYAVVKNALDAGANENWFLPLTGHTSLLTDAPADMKGNRDGFLLVNADSRYAGYVFYMRRLTGLCTNTYYDFSAYIANVAMEVNGAPVKMRIQVYGGGPNVTEANGELLIDVSTVELPPRTEWTAVGASFNTRNYENVLVTVTDNVTEDMYSFEGVGNDIAIDDILFSTCSPDIALYNPDGSRYEGAQEVCDRATGSVNLQFEAAAVYDLTEFFQQPWYLLQTATSANGPWTNVGSPTTSPSFSVTIDESQTTPVFYRVWVAASESSVLTASSGGTLTGCGNVSAVSDPTSFVYACPCETPTFDLTGSTVVCLTSPVADFTASNISESQRYEWLKNDVVVESGSTNGSNPITYTDNAVATEEGTVTYGFRVYNGTCFNTQTIDVTVLGTLNFGITSSAPNNSICVGSQVTINTNYSLGSNESIEWYADGVLINGESGATLTVSPTATTTYRAVLVGGSCDGEGEILIYVDSPAAPSIEIDNSVICAGSAINVTDTDTSTAQTYVWYIDGTTPTVISGQTGKDLVGYVPEASCTIYKESINGNCAAESNRVSVEVHPAIEFNVSANPADICEGQSTELIMTGYPDGAQLQWIDNSSLLVISTNPNVIVDPLQTTVYTAVVTGVCTANKDISVTVYPPIDASVGRDEYQMCEGSSVQIAARGTGATSYRWTPVGGLDDPTSATPTASPTATTVYTVIVSNGVCEERVSTTVRVNGLPRVLSVEAEQTENCEDRAMTIVAEGGTPPYQFAIDDGDFTTQDSFMGTESGWRIIHVKDASDCQSDTTYYLEPYPILPDRFFSPNGDGLNDIWNVGNLDCYPAYILQIFERSGRKVFEARKGKFATENSSEFVGWDGNYNGHQLRSDDYWYLITIETVRRQYTGHFTLKR